MSRSACAAVLLAVLCGIAGCANLETISRSTSVPLGQGGKAVHLDAQQRLVVFAANRYCAEPSPDALAAYAAALGFSAPKLPSKALAASGALNSVAGSIGLRTQSITLMRDTLYRICEGRLNNTLSDEQVAVLMSRSQDLTAVILATEQLTGAVAAPPVTLTTGGSSSALASLTANTEALNAAEAAEAKQKAERDTTATAAKDAKTEWDAAKAKAKKAEDDSSPDAPALEAAATSAGTAYQVAQTNAAAAQTAYERLHENTEQVRQARDAANAVTAAAVSSGASAGSFAQRSLSGQDVAKVADTVKQMVTELLHKDYFLDTCLATLTSPGAEEALKNLQQLQKTGAVANMNVAGAAQTPGELAAQLQMARGLLIERCLTYMGKIQPRTYSQAVDQKTGAASDHGQDGGDGAAAGSNDGKAPGKT